MKVLTSEIKHNPQPTMPNDNLHDFFDENRKLASEYLDTRLEILKLSLVRSASKTLGVLAFITIICFLMLMFLLFLVISFSWWMTALMGSAALGYLTGSGVFILLIIICFIFRKPLFVNPFVRLFLVSSLDEDEDDEY
jgi:hypothetical protein